MIELKEINAAYRRIKQYIRRTPCEHSYFYSSHSDAEVYIKCENLQISGSIKIRGSLNQFLQLSRKEKQAGVVTATGGDYAIGVAYAAKIAGFEKETTIVIPSTTPITILDRIKIYNVELMLVGNNFDEAETFAKKYAEKEHKIFLSSYNNSAIIAGQGTVGLELLEEVPDADFILVPVGGGSVLAGMICAMKPQLPEVIMYGVQSESSPIMAESYKKGQIISLPIQPTIATGIEGNIEKNSITFEPIKSCAEDILLVNEQEIKYAIRALIVEHNLLAEGSGAVGLAALLRYPQLFKGKKGVVIITNGHLDIKVLRSVVAE